MERAKTYTKEEILIETNIRLDKEWDIFLTKFIEYDKAIHQDECAYVLSDFNSNTSCNCKPRLVPSIIARIMAYGEQYFQCVIWEAKENIPENHWDYPIEVMLQLPILAEDVKNGLNTIAELVKAYEVSGNTDYDFFKLKMPDGQILEGKELYRAIYS